MSTLHFAREFENLGHKSYIFCVKDSPLHKACQEQNITYYSFRPRNYLSPATSFKMHSLFKSKKIDALFCHRLKDLWLTYPALIRLNQIKQFGVAHMMLNNIKKTDLLHRVIYNRLHQLFTITQVQTRQLQKCLPVPEDKYRLIPNSIDLEKYKPKNQSPEIRSQLGAYNDDFLIGAVGRLDPQKGQQWLLESFKELADDYPHIKLVFVGADTIGEDGKESPFSAELKAYVENKNLTQRVKFLGLRKDIPQILNNLDLFVMPSKKETFGLVLIEAMASALPCIASRAGGVPEIITEGQDGLLFTSGSTKDLKDKLNQVLNSPELKQKMAQKALETCQKRYDKDFIFQQYQSYL